MAHNVSIDAHDRSIQFPKGRWLQLTNQDGFSTKDAGASVTFDFDGDFVSVTGSLITDDSSDESPYLSYILDGQDDSSFTLNTAVISTQSLYAANLSSQGHHQLQMSLTNDRARLTIEGMTFTTNEGTDAAASERRKAKIAGGTVGAIVFLALCLLGFFLYRRRRIRAAAADPYSLSPFPLQASMPTSKEAFTSKNHGPYGISFIPSTETLASLPAKQTPRFTPLRRSSIV